MNEPKDWLEQTWEIKRNIARRYAGVSMSDQIQDMRRRLREEFERQGWPYPVLSGAQTAKRLDTPSE